MVLPFNREWRIYSFIWPPARSCTSHNLILYWIYALSEEDFDCILTTLHLVFWFLSCRSSSKLGALAATEGVTSCLKNTFVSARGLAVCERLLRRGLQPPTVPGVIINKNDWHFEVLSAMPGNIFENRFAMVNFISNLVNITFYEMVYCRNLLCSISIVNK